MSQHKIETRRQSLSFHAALDKERRLNRANQTDFTRHKPQKLHASAA